MNHWPVNQTNAQNVGAVSTMLEVTEFIWRSLSKYAAPLTAMFPELKSLNQKLVKRWIRDGDKLAHYLSG